MTAVHYAIRHETLYRYRRDVAHAHQQLHLTPRNSERQHCVLHRIDITPQPAVSAEYKPTATQPVAAGQATADSSAPGTVAPAGSGALVAFQLVPCRVTSMPCRLPRSSR